MAAGDVITISEKAGDARLCAAFDGTDDYILADAHAVARVAAGDTVGTYSAWIFCDDIGGDYAILSVGDNNAAGETLKFYLFNNKLYVQTYFGAVKQSQVGETVGSITAKKWHHVAVVQNGTNPVLYVDGSAVAMTNDTATDLTCWFDVLVNCDKFAIGVLESNGAHSVDFPGYISDVKYWNKALTAAEVAQDYAGEALDDDGTYLQLHLLDGYNGVTDQGLGADNGTLTGHAYLAGWGSKWSRKVELNSTGHAAEFITSHIDGDKYVTEIKRGD